MSKLDELSALLTERGAKWFDADGRVVIGVDEPATVASFKDYDGLLLGMMYTCCTPEQAVEATLGRGECRNTAPSYLDFLCSECGFVHYHSDENDSGGGNEWRYCPNCGRRVEQ